MLSTFIKHITSIFYKLFYCKGSIIKSSLIVKTIIRCKKTNVCSVKNSYLKKTKINITGNNNKCNINSTLVDSSIIVSGTNNRIDINNQNVINSLKLHIYGHDCCVRIEIGTSINGAQMVCMGRGTKIIIGKDCMFANKIDVWASDSHPIFNHDNDVINSSKDIIIDEHVWVCEKSSILKGVHIGKNAIVGMAAVVSHDIPESSIVVGNPAKVIKNGINWSRDRIEI